MSNKITNDNYFLPEILALEAIRIFDSGVTQPMLIRGVCNKTYLKDDYVVKFKTSLGMDLNASSRELIASSIAMELGLNVAEPVLVNITQDFIGSINIVDKNNYLRKSIGLNFGCKYASGYYEFLNNQVLNEKQHIHATKIFAFDILISNSDRRIDKQNMLTNGADVLIFDHEKAFGFIFDIVKKEDPWKIFNNDLYWIRNHYFFCKLKGRYKKEDFEFFIESFKLLDNIFWEKLESIIPNEWSKEHFYRIKSNLISIINKRNIFIKELKQILL